MRKLRTWRECLIERLTNRERAVGYLQAILEDYQICKSPSVVLKALQTVIEAQGGVFELAKQTDMDPQHLGKMLSEEDIPLIDRLGTVLKVLGYQLSIQPIEIEGSDLKTYTEALEGQKTSAQVAENPND
ncbi:hypothetical protein F4083_00980 [Candidatus Poribacteria bacterium]|nr:hypothetical protein [Candidatus Poribacteria bacterium]MYB66163.1 hypothetical protein [Candidatus Poribacteria bacterium]MYF56161.1 hypothetical protein [Candidatus Poribacteria bacterium]MYI92893.1 hypothetical protein [Candidatus Poribacteria bacterium]